MDAKILNRAMSGLKILAKGEIKTAVNIVADKWSAAAEAAAEARSRSTAAA